MFLISGITEKAMARTTSTVKTIPGCWAQFRLGSWNLIGEKFLKLPDPSEVKVGWVTADNDFIGGNEQGLVIYHVFKDGRDIEKVGFLFNNPHVGQNECWTEIRGDIDNSLAADRNITQGNNAHAFFHIYQQTLTANNECDNGAAGGDGGHTGSADAIACNGGIGGNTSASASASASAIGTSGNGGSSNGGVGGNGGNATAHSGNTNGGAGGAGGNGK